MEVSTLVSLAPTEVREIHRGHDLLRKGEQVLLVVLHRTARLRRIVEKLGLSPIYLADADHRRIANFERWGNYYAEQPRVFAITSPPLAAGHFRSAPSRAPCDLCLTPCSAMRARTAPPLR